MSLFSLIAVFFNLYCFTQKPLRDLDLAAFQTRCLSLPSKPNASSLFKLQHCARDKDELPFKRIV